MGRHTSKFGIQFVSQGVWEVFCPGWNLGLCAGHKFTTKREARNWITKEEEGK
jgi:hypothetical protein